MDDFELRKVGFCIYGHSWDRMLASIYSGRKSRGLHKLVIANSCLSSALSPPKRENDCSGCCPSLMLSCRWMQMGNTTSQNTKRRVNASRKSISAYSNRGLRYSLKHHGKTARECGRLMARKVSPSSVSQASCMTMMPSRQRNTSKCQHCSSQSVRHE